MNTVTRTELEVRCWHEIVNLGNGAHIEPGPDGDVLYVNGRVVATTRGAA